MPINIYYCKMTSDMNTKIARGALITADETSELLGVPFEADGALVGLEGRGQSEAGSASS